MSQDRQFFDMFMLIIGILVGIAIALFFLAREIQSDTQAEYRKADPLVQQLTDQRIETVGRVVMQGSAEPPPQAPAAETVVAQVRSGPEVYDQACMACHTTGAGGAPKIGDAAAWQPRIAQGQETLVQHAINGYQGEKGYMPPKGGRADLTDDEVAAAVEHMVSQSQ